MNKYQRQIILRTDTVALIVDRHEYGNGFRVGVLWSAPVEKYEEQRVWGAAISHAEAGLILTYIESGLDLESALSKAVGCA